MHLVEGDKLGLYEKRKDYSRIRTEPSGAAKRSPGVSVTPLLVVEADINKNKLARRYNPTNITI
jgi:hypothetical protein